MQSFGSNIVTAISFICGTLSVIGTLLFFYGYIVSGLSEVIGIGIGIVMGAVFIFIMGIFLAITEEMYTKEGKGAK
ncbi:hypothetical protein D8M04_09695 [Oceanobacillus piezotolerans]|uniref:Uncharacterized protein n=1 Tax=Oceanobacillus piezotolerans TaxID=2448030 RepID=A0A498D929_9BACI|nr:hypothetical protein [Oceanobacillus piezotolerans]RLL45131.1 hypothetical protein D8M04_09695 [Oceanobacillus piezotolerans]